MLTLNANNLNAWWKYNTYFSVENIRLLIVERSLSDLINVHDKLMKLQLYNKNLPNLYYRQLFELTWFIKYIQFIIHISYLLEN